MTEEELKELIKKTPEAPTDDLGKDGIKIDGKED